MSEQKKSNLRMPNALETWIGMCALMALFFMWEFRDINEKIVEVDKEGEQRVVDTTTVNYSLSEDGYIEKVILKSEEGTKVITNNSIAIMFKLDKNSKELTYEITSSGDTLTLRGPEYPSEKYIIKK